jgi:hypothetical protein
VTRSTGGPDPPHRTRVASEEVGVAFFEDLEVHEELRASAPNVIGPNGKNSGEESTFLADRSILENLSFGNEASDA